MEEVDGLEPAAVKALLERVDERGTSDPDLTLQEALAGNRAGPDEEELSVEEILEQYSS
ncbi:MAG: hypothetical protein J2O48_02690 [Solirubrobacterales bacterium]|nr:hypothetical protein [Solirubrobacterales bacterium]